jgi:hypothetical protein
VPGRPSPAARSHSARSLQQACPPPPPTISIIIVGVSRSGH